MSEQSRTSDDTIGNGKRNRRVAWGLTAAAAAVGTVTAIGVSNSDPQQPKQYKVAGYVTPFPDGTAVLDTCVTYTNDNHDRVTARLGLNASPSGTALNRSGEIIPVAIDWSDMQPAPRQLDPTDTGPILSGIACEFTIRSANPVTAVLPKGIADVVIQNGVPIEVAGPFTQDTVSPDANCPEFNLPGRIATAGNVATGACVTQYTVRAS